MKSNRSLPILAVIAIIAVSSAYARVQEPESVMDGLHDALQRKDITDYAEYFSPSLRESEKAVIEEKMRLVSLVAFSYSLRNADIDGDTLGLIVRPVFKNDYSFVFETWNIHLTKTGERWMISAKTVNPDTSTMFNIEIPSDNYERVKTIEIEHVDIRLTFEDAILFYDNIPDIETALLILGPGHVRFSPSHPREKHILQLLHKNQHVEDDIDYAYLRFSRNFFEHNIKIIRYPETAPPVDISKEKNKAYSLFVKHYSRSFTVENSLTGDVLSVLPRGEQAVIEFTGKKFGTHSYIYYPRGKESVNFYEWENDRVISLYSPLSETGEKRMSFGVSEEYDLQHYQADLDYDPETSYIAAKVKVDLLSRHQNLRFARFRFNPELSILRIMDDKKQELFFTQDKLRNSLYVYFIEPLAHNERIELEIFYRGKLLPAEHVGEIFYYRKYGEDFMKIPFNQDTFYFGPSIHWYPQPPFDDYFTAAIQIITPPEYTAISNGSPLGRSKLNGLEEVDRIDDMGNIIHAYQSDKPLKSLSFIVGLLSLKDEETVSVPLQVFRATSTSATQDDLAGETGKILRFYKEKFGLFPYDHLSVVQRAWTTLGGLSAASFLVLQEFPRTFRRYGMKKNATKSPVDLSRWEGYFLAHEIAHQWWGHGVTWKTYHDLWLSEGLSQYAAILYLKEKFGGSAVQDIKQKFIKQVRKSSQWGPITLGSRISHLDYEAYQTIIYNKTALALDMLRYIMGDELFFKGLKSFFTEYKYKAATTYDFKRTMEAAKGQELDQFFRGWFDSYDLPQVDISHSIQAKEDRVILELRVTQIQRTFVFPLLIEWQEDGKDRHKRIIVDKRRQEFLLLLPVKPKKIRINADNAVPGRFKH